MFLNTNLLRFLHNINLPTFDISSLGIETTRASSKKKKKSPWRIIMFALICTSLDWVSWIPDIPSVAKIIFPFGGG